MELLQTQVAFFINGKITIESFVSSLKSTFPSSQIQYFPNIPDEPNFSIPRLTLSVAEPKLIITVYDSRVDMVFSGEIDDNLLSDVISSLITSKMHIKRIGFVKTDFQEVSADNYKTLLPTNKIEGLDIKEVGLHINLRKHVVGRAINSVEKVNPGSVGKDNTKRNGLVIQRDCNTLAEEQLPPKLSFQQVKDLILGLRNEAKTSILI